MSSIELSCTYADEPTNRAHGVSVRLPPGFALDLAVGQTVQLDAMESGHFEVGNSSFVQLTRDDQIVVSYWRTGLFSGGEGCSADPPEPDFAAMELSSAVGECDQPSVDFIGPDVSSRAPVGAIAALSDSLVAVVEDPIPEPPAYCRFEAMVFAPG